MIIDEVKRELESEKSEIAVRGPILTYPDFQIWGDVKITSFVGQPISSTTLLNENIGVGFNACVSGAMLGPPYPLFYRVDNSPHMDLGLHEHNGTSVSKVEAKTIGEALKIFFNKFLGAGNV